MLKHCPFCGKSAAYIVENRCLFNDFISYSLHHQMGQCILSEWQCLNVFDTVNEAVTTWNKRIKQEEA